MTEAEFVSLAERAALSFVTKLSLPSETAIFYHGDSDGCASAALMSAAIRTINGWFPGHVIAIGTEEFNFEKVSRYIQSSSVRDAIFLDISIHSRAQVFDRTIRALRSIAVIDDHTSDWNERRDNLLYLNPQQAIANLTRSIPASALLWYLTSNALGEKAAWVSLVGLINDGCEKAYPDVLEICQRRYSTIAKTHGTSRSDTNMTVAGFREITRRVNASLLTDRADSNIAYKALLESLLRDKPEELLDISSRIGGELFSSEKIISSEIEIAWSDFETRSRFDEKTKSIFFEVESKFRISSIVSTLISLKFLEYIIFVYQQLGDQCLIEVRRRRGGRVDLTEVLRACCAQIPCFAVGGHPGAAGASVAPAQLDRFRALFLSKIADVPIQNR